MGSDGLARLRPHELEWIARFWQVVHQD